MPRVALRGLVLVLSIALAPAFLRASPEAHAQSASSERLILTPSADTTFRVQAVYDNAGITCETKKRKDLNARYRGKLEIIRQTDGRLAIIDHVTFDEYLRGLAEVPRSWPSETLKAQVVAARSYGLYHLNHPTESGRKLGYDICSTDQCQVYRGVQVEQGAFGDAWIRAVTETRGRALLYNGDPIQAFYHSTSPGKTKRSFPGGSPLPYLASVDGQDDDSPLAKWTVRIPLKHLGPILREDGEWSGATLTSVRLDGSTVRLSGSGSSASLGKDSFRGVLNREASCVYPDDYPTPGSTGSKLPQTVPSIDFSLKQDGNDVVLTGRGWGHGVGMSQYGARSLAERSHSYAESLAYYYAGIRPSRVTEPGTIRVLVVEDASRVRVAIEGKADVETATGSTLAPGDRFEVRGGPTLDIRRGIGPNLTPVLTVDVVIAPLTIPPDGTIALSYTLSRAAKVVVVVRRDGKEVIRTAEVSQISGPNVFSIPLRTGTPPAPPSSATASASPAPARSVTPTPTTTVQVTPTPPLTSGDYEVQLEAYDGLDRVRTAPVGLVVQPSPTPTPRAEPPDDAGGSGVLTIFGVIAVLIAGGGILLALRRRAR